jgi:multidrug efflux pump subunit AcrB/outer membrane protein TolC
MNLARFSIRHPSLVWFLLVVIAAWGLFTYKNISRREDPEIKISVALVITVWPGKGAEDVERLVTKKLEDEFEKISALKELKSITRENVSLIVVDVDFSADADMMWQKLRNQIEEARPNLPEGIIGPDVMDDIGDVTAMVWSLSSKSASPRELKKWAKEFRARLSEVESVGKVNLLGEQQEVIYIEGPLDSFTMYNFNPLRAAQIIDYHNVNMPAGYIRTPERNFRLDASGSFELIDNIKNAVIDISQTTGHPLRVRDVFSVRRGYREPPTTKMLTKGDLSIGFDIRMKRGYNIVALGEQVKKVAQEFRKNLPPEISLNVLHDQPREVDEFIGHFMENLIEGLIIVIVVMFLIMGLRSTLIVAVSLPMSIVITIALMPMFGVDLENISIAAFIIALGMLVDNAIIITDNIDRRLEAGDDPTTAASLGTHELIKPVISGTLATVGAFLPLLLMKDEMGAYIRSLPIVVSISMVASLVLAITITPIMGRLFMKPPKKKVRKQTGRPSWLVRGYERMMRRGMQFRHLVLLASFLGLVGAVMLIPKVGLSFFPEVDRDQMTIDVWLPEGAGIERTEKTVRQIEEILAQEPAIVNWATYLGDGGPRFHITVMPQFATLCYARFMITTRDKNETRALVERLKVRFRNDVSGALVKPANMLMGIPVEAPIAIKISGPDINQMRNISQQVQTILRATPGTDLVRDDLGQEVQSLELNVDSEAAAMFGLSSTDVALTLLTVHEGLPVSEYRVEEDKIPIHMRVVKDERRSFQTLDQIRVTSQFTGAKVPLSAFAGVSPKWAPGVIHRLNNRRTVTVLSGVSGRLASEVMREAWPKIQAINTPPGYSVRSEGEEKERDKAFAELIVIFLLIIGALLLMLVIQFNSIKQAFTILFSVPLAIIGAVLGLFFSNNSFSFMAFLGVVSLAGMVIKNAVVWVEFVNRALAEGQSLEDAIVEAGIKRARPIMLTAATTIGGLLPLALFGGILWEGMAWAMIFGLAMATVLGLVVVPIVFYLMFRRSGSNMKFFSTALIVLLIGAWPAVSGAQHPQHPIEGYLQIANQESLLNQGAWLGVEEAEAGVQMAKFSFIPTPSFEASATRLDRSLVFALDTESMNLPIPLEFPEMVLAEQNIYQLAGKLTLPLYVGGKRFAYLSAAKHGLAAQNQVKAATNRGVSFGVIAAYVQLLEANRLSQIWQERLDSDQKLVEIAKAKMKAEMGVPFDVSFAETIAADSRRQLEEARGLVSQRQYNFNNIVGRPLEAAIELKELKADFDFAPDLTELMEEVTKRPELQARIEGALAMSEQVRAEKSGLWPTVVMLGEAGYKDGDFGYIGGREYWQVTLAMQWNLMLDANVWAKAEEAHIKAQKADLEVTKTRKDLELELTKAYRLFQDTKRITKVAKAGLETAEKGYQNAKASYDHGVLPLATLVEASKALVEARQNYTRAGYGLLLAEVQLRYISGLALLLQNNL